MGKEGILNDAVELLRLRREQAGLTVSELARRAGVSKSQVSRVERGKSSLTLRTFERLANVVGFSTTDLLVVRHQEQGTVSSMLELNLALGDLPQHLQESTLRAFWSTLAGIRSAYERW